MDNKSIYAILDVIMSEYGWGLDYCMQLPSDVLMAFYNVISERRKQNYALNTKLMAIAVNAGFSGDMKKLDSLFKDDKQPEQDPDAWKAQLKGLWLRMGKSETDFEKRWANGEAIEL